MKPGVSDTSADAEHVLIEGFRLMSPREKLQRVVALNRALEQLARARIRAQYGADLTERELRLRLVALRLDRATMVRVFGWDPEVEGYWGPMNEILDLTLFLAESIERLGVAHLVGGSLASSLHGLPRATHDVDLVAELTLEDVPKLVAALRGSFYLDEAAIRTASTTALR